MSEAGVPGDEGRGLRCPRCAVPLEETGASENVVQGCDSCGGVWIDHETLARVGRDVHAANVLASRVAIRGRARVLDQKPIACPVCTTPLRRARVQATEVDVDYCAAHGTWLDWGEILPFIAPGTDGPPRSYTVEELEASGVPDKSQGSFFGKLARLVSRG